MIPALVEIFAELLKALVGANSDAAAEEEALMVAESKLARLRAEAKFR